jgi:hypothetical protein
MDRYLVQLGDCQTSEQNDDQNGEQATDGYDRTTPPSVARPQRIICAPYSKPFRS